MKPILIFFAGLFLFTMTSGCQTASEDGGKSTARQPNSPTTSPIQPDSLRRVMEAKVTYPPQQTISLERMAPRSYPGAPTLQYLGYVDGAFQFKQTDDDGQEVDSLWLINVHFDNFEPTMVQSNTVPFQLPEGDHIICAYLLDENGLRVQTEHSTTAQMIRIKNGEIIKAGDPGLLVYYNKPRAIYSKDASYVPADFLILNELPGEMTSVNIIIDGQIFREDRSGSFRIKGLKPGNHMMEIDLQRLGESHNGPLNPSRMTFRIQ